MLLKKILAVGALGAGLWGWPETYGIDKKEDKKEKIENPLSKDKTAAAAGRTHYETGCAVCHGPGGGGGRGPRLKEAPRVRQLDDHALFEIIKNGVKGTEMLPATAGETEIWQMVSFIRSLNAKAIDEEAPGDARAGGSLFFGKGNCAQCHMIRGRGGFIGPDLSNLGSNRSLEQIRTSITNPDESVEPGFKAVSVQTRDGRRVTGVAKNDSSYSIQLMDREGRLHVFLKSEIRELVRYKKSLMPAPTLSPAEMQDLLAFLSRQSTESPSEELKAVEHGKEKRP